ncbi:DUF4845 domain-containing protein [Nevskia sp.]|uniref:DUF4845 domain-containing protein n=1 Tax=Nevskia sp. TaxID=1929292 RepID=UPI0025DE306D|nr:DUF4845 domain-containing protein [Nevskia sp.]
MKARTSQLGMTLWSGLYLFGSLAFIALCGIKIGPLYLNEFTINRAVRDVAAQSSVVGSEVDVAAVRSALQRRWDIDYIDQLEPRDIKVVRTAAGLFLSYDYDAEVPLFANIIVVARFADDIPLRAVPGG